MIRIEYLAAVWAFRRRIGIAAINVHPAAEVVEPADALAEPVDRAHRRAVSTRVRRVWPAFLAMGLLFVLYSGANRVPADPTELLSLEGQVSSAQTNQLTIRVGTFNMHSGKGTDGEVDLDRTAACLSELDLVGLYEVRGALPMFRENQAKTLGKKLEMAWLFAPTERRWWHNHFGNALLTSIDLDGFQRIPLPASQDKAFRNALLVSFPLDGRKVRLLITHIDSDRDRQRQLRSVIHLFLSLEQPAILMGDLNTTRSDPQLQELLAIPEVRDVLVEASNEPEEADHIDWILTRGLHCISSRLQPTDASDHPVVWAELEIDTPHREAGGWNEPGYGSFQ